ncbi:carbohydrate ABC transporter permease [Streptomyces smyrnaeus]|uniref:carbohydrate ABC transporter permease n=1 Tax=Streptomyces TaxID=1883 RepID=UPI000C19470E|nr:MULTISPECIES: carbohydrate ABC transporter permease [unclassified Streptomyces]MBQ0864125.1 carbohydrate ABC transporter permease [Streptomyces sp. RK75]MBQ1120028.1 carbohydrate ABC transporter permease [Streptomyces sp. B15]MBQ1160318.1 carbohydrate ABC transporter permease [Streptomyces sp. A73]
MSAEPMPTDAVTDQPTASATSGSEPAAGRRTAGRKDGGSGERGALNVFSHAFLIAWVVMAAGPLIWVAMTAFRPTADFLNDPMGLPTSIHWQNFANAWTEAKIGRYAFNSLVILAGSLTGTMLLGSMAAYVIARFTFPGNRFIFLLFAGGMMFPVILALIPLFTIMDNMSLLDTRPGLIIAYIAYSLPFTTFFLTSFFRTLPSGVQEAAMIDGASHTRTFFQVMLPMAKPGLVSIGIFNFLGQWNQYLLPLLLNNEDENNYVLPQGLAALTVSQGYAGDWGALFAGLTIAMVPVLVVYAVFQRQVQAGLTAGAIK